MVSSFLFLSIMVGSTYYVMTRHLMVSRENTYLVLGVFLLISIPAIAYSYWRYFERKRSGKTDEMYSALEKLARFSERDYKILYWFMGLFFVPLFTMIYAFMMAFVLSFTVGLFYDASKTIEVFLLVLAFIFAISTYYMIGTSIRKNLK